MKEIREKFGFTQEALAKKLAIKQSTISMWETGKSKPRYDMLIKLTSIFNCTVDELFDSKEPKQNVN